MRDITIVAMVVVLALVALRRPWIGVLLWAWISLMNPHRYAWGFAYDFPVAAMAAAATLLGLMFCKERDNPFKGPPVAWFVVFTLWMTLSWRMGLDPAGDYEQWDKVMKINLMVIVGLVLIRSKEQIMLLMWVCALSLALLGAKGGVFTILNGGSYRVWGPPGTFIGDNNEFALALVMTIPLLRFLQLQMPMGRWRHGMTVLMVLTAAAALGSHSRGGLLAITAMTLLLWWRGRNRLAGGVVIVAVGIALLLFMPEEWTNRMSTIDEYAEDDSALGRFSAWWVSWRVAQNYPFGIGYTLPRPELFAMYSPYPHLGTPVAHSIYFQVMGHHGFIGLFFFLMIWISTWFMAWRIKKRAEGIPEARWCADLANMCQVSLVGYLVGGAFLSLSYFDLPYNIMSLVVMTHLWLVRQRWRQESPKPTRWRAVLGIVPPESVPPKGGPRPLPPGQTVAR